MFRFTAQGTIGRIQSLPKAQCASRLPPTASSKVRPRPGRKPNGLAASPFDPALGKQIEADLQVGQSVTLEGRLVPRSREVDGKKQYETMLEVTGFKAGAKPKANGKAKSAAADTSDAASARPSTSLGAAFGRRRSFTARPRAMPRGCAPS